MTRNYQRRAIMRRNYQLVYYNAENVGIIGILAYPKSFIIIINLYTNINKRCDFILKHKIGLHSFIFNHGSSNDKTIENKETKMVNTHSFHNFTSMQKNVLVKNIFIIQKWEEMYINCQIHWKFSIIYIFNNRGSL